MSQGPGLVSNGPKKPESSPLSLFQIILMSMKETPDVNWDEVAAKAGYNSGRTARERYHQIKRKLKSNESGESTTPSPRKPRSGNVKSKDTIGSGTNNSSSKIRKSTATNGRGRTVNGMMGGSFAQKLQKRIVRAQDNGGSPRYSFDSNDVKEEVEY